MALTVSPPRIGIFGGAFDPPHLAHAALAKSAIEQLGLDELRVIPTGEAWHKDHCLTVAQHRLTMTQLAFAELAKVVIDERELRRTGPSYSIDTLRELMIEQPSATFFLLLGEDQAGKFSTWREWRAIAEHAVLVVARRSSAITCSISKAYQDFRTTLPVDRVRDLHFAPRTVSATEIRALAQARTGIAHLVGLPVARYIEDHHLYQNH